MADKGICIEHPLLRKCLWVNLPEKVKEEPKKAEAQPKEEVARQDECRRNEECRNMLLRLQTLTGAKFFGLPGL